MLLKKHRNIIVLILVMIHAVLFTACSPAPDAPTDEPVVSDGVQDKVEDYVPSVGLLAGGSFSDMGWNALAYEGVMEIQKKYGAQVTAMEHIAQSDVEGLLLDLCNSGHEIIFLNNSLYQDAVQAVAPKYPDTKFILILTGEIKEPNVIYIQVADIEQGFLAGAFAALMTQTGKVGIIGGLEIDPIRNTIAGFHAGAKYIDPNVEALSLMTGSFDDAGAAKEAALALIDSGADYVTHAANEAGLGVLEAAAERGVYAIGGVYDQHDAYPEAVVTSVAKVVSKAFILAYEGILDGTFDAGLYRVGVAEGLIYLTPYYNFEDFVPESVKQRMNELIDDIKNGRIDI